MTTMPPLLFALSESQVFAQSVAGHLGLALSTVEEHRYEDGEYKCSALEPVAGRDVVVLSGLYAEAGLTVHDKLCRLLFFAASIKDAGARHLQVVSPYLCYSRKDRRIHAQDSVITRHLATLMEASRIDNLTTLEVHNQAAFDNAFRIPTRHLETTQLFVDYILQGFQEEALVIASPDLGGIKRAERLRQVLEQQMGRPIGHACVEKYRSENVLNGSKLVGHVDGCTVILIDDLISTGGTLLRAAEACYRNGARQVYAMATHGLFTTGSELAESTLLERIVVSDSIPSAKLESVINSGHLEVLDTSNLFAASLEAQYAIGGIV